MSGVVMRWARATLVLYWIALAVVTHWPRLDLPNPEVFDGLLLDKLTHFASFLILMGLAQAASLAGRGRSLWRNYAFAAMIVAAYAVIDESTQPWFARTFDPIDLVADLLAVACVGGAMLLWSAVSVTFGNAPTSARKPNSQHPRTDEAGSVEPPPSLLDASQPKPFVGHAVLISMLTLVSRVTGLVRESLLGAVFGLSNVSGAFMIGFIVPNLFRRLFGEGALAAAFIPIYSELRRNDPAAARRLASSLVALLLIVLGGLTCAGELLLWAMLNARQWSADSHLAIGLTMTMLPYMPLICLVALLGGILQVHGRFGPPAAAPIVLNLIMIGGIALSAATLTNQADAAETFNPRSRIFIVAVSVLAAGIVQLAWQAAAMFRCQSLTGALTGSGPALKRVMLAMGPMIIGLAVFQINTLLDVLIAFGLSPKHGGAQALTMFGRTIAYPIEYEGATAALVFAQRLYQFPLGIFGVAIATAIFPALSHAAADAQDRSPFRTTFQQGLRLTVFIGLPASVGLVIVALPLCRLVYQYRQVSTEDAGRIAIVLTGYAAGVWAYSMTHVLTRAYYAVKDTITPLKISVAMVGLNLVLNLSLVWVIGVAALAWSTAGCAALQVVLLIIGSRRFVNRPIDAAVRRSWGKSLLITMIMAAALAPAVAYFNVAAMTRTASAALLAVLVLIGIAIVAAGGVVCKADELKWITRRGR